MFRPRLIITDPKVRIWDLMMGTQIRKQKVFTLEITNTRKRVAKRCVAILTILDAPPGVTLFQQNYPLHWADTDYSPRTTGAVPIEIGPEGNRLDVAFSFLGQPQAGCWAAIPMALASMQPTNQAYLPPGEYRVCVKIHCENGFDTKKTFILQSPKTWDALEAREP